MKRRRGFRLSLLAILVLSVPAGLWSQGDGPPYAPEDAVKTLRIVEGFQVDVFAAEPLIASPVAMEVDEHGRMFVVEMPGYPLDVGGSGRIKQLHDTNGDGLPDRSTVFADKLVLPTGIMRWKNGFLVTDSPHVWYLEDADGDGRAEIKKEILRGFALTNPQHTTNTPVYGLDNWIYLANEGPVRTIRYRDIFGDAGGEVHFPDRPDGPRLPPDGDGRNVRFKPDTYELETLSSRSQFGQTFDAWGHHFLVTNNRHIFHEVIGSRYLTRNPSLVAPSTIEQVPDYPLPAALFPITHNPEFQLLTDVGVMTSASGLTWYNADLFPPAYRNAAFVGEGAHNLVHVVSVRDHGATFRASRMFDGREFLASTDAWFRPVNFYIGPDGALYLIDYYRKVFEHPEWTDDTVAKSKDLYAGQDRGRIYRITPTGTKPASWLDRTPLGKAAVAELVRTLAHPNIWWRRHAQRLLMDRKPTQAAEALTTVLTGESAVGRVHALWTLGGLGLIDAAHIERALRDETPGVRENAIKVAEAHLERQPSLVAALLRMTGDPDPKVRYQLLLTLGDVTTPDASAARAKLLFDHVEDEWMQLAGLSAAALDARELLRAAVERLGSEETPGRRTFFSRLGAMCGAATDTGVMRGLLRDAAKGASAANPWWQAAALEGLAGGIPPERRKAADIEPERQRVAQLFIDARAEALRPSAVRLLDAIGLPSGESRAALVRFASGLVSDRNANPKTRAEAVQVLALDRGGAHDALLRGLLERAESADVQVAAVRALAAPPGDAVAKTFLALWNTWTPAVRDEAVRALLREPGRIRVLLDALESGAVKISEIDWPLRVRMMMTDDPQLRARARGLLSRPADAGKATLARYAEATTRPGNVDRGREVFERVCSVCHQYRGAGGTAFGPDLGEVRGRLPDALLLDILQPNHSIADGYELWLVELSDGTSLSGVIASETPNAVTFRQQGGSTSTIARAKIASMRIAPMSAMPEGLDSQIDVQQMADLIAFIRGGQ